MFKCCTHGENLIMDLHDCWTGALLASTCIELDISELYLYECMNRRNRLISLELTALIIQLKETSVNHICVQMQEYDHDDEPSTPCDCLGR